LKNCGRGKTSELGQRRGQREGVKEEEIARRGQKKVREGCGKDFKSTTALVKAIKL